MARPKDSKGDKTTSWHRNHTNADYRYCGYYNFNHCLYSYANSSASYCIHSNLHNTRRQKKTQLKPTVKEGEDEEQGEVISGIEQGEDEEQSEEEGEGPSKAKQPVKEELIDHSLSLKELKTLRPLVKTEIVHDGGEAEPTIITKEIPYTVTELAKLGEKYSRLAMETEMEYVWRVSLTGGDRIRFSEEESQGYWGPGIFLTVEDDREPWSLTQRAAYWAGGLNPLERGDPLSFVGTVDQLVENVQKAACLQMMYDWELKFKQESSMMIPVNPERMTPLIRGLPDSLKPIAIQLQGIIQATPQSERTVAALEVIVPPDHRSQKLKVWTWGEVAQELINYGWKYDPVNVLPTKTDPKGLKRTEMRLPPHLGNSKRMSLTRPLSGGDILNKHNNFWTTGWRKDIPGDLMNDLSTDKLEKLILQWPEKFTTTIEASKTLIPSVPPTTC
ncbi:uncharacterized protein [Patagioenas fasciata]|uniref:uncharacterized protein n=1 Tax=Patagioenas fasciata TaxID=372321 RepID=UPI003A9970C7